MPAADHAKTVGARKITRRRKLSDGLLAGVDEIRVFLALIRERPHTEHAVFALQLNAHAVRDVVRHERRDADAEIDVKSVAQFLGGAGRHLVTSPGHQTSSPAPAAAA